MAKEPLITQFKEYEWIEASPGVSKSKQRLMIVMHGRGDSLKSFRSIKEELNLPEMNYLLLNAPRRYDGGYTWYAFPPKQAHGVLQSREKLTLLLGELNEQGFPPENIFLYGLSQGSLVGCDFAMNSGVRIGGVIAISGYIYFFENWQRDLCETAFHIPMLITHGVFDEDLPMLETKSQVRKLKAAGLKILWKEFNKAHEIDLKEETPFIRKWVRAQIHKSSQRSRANKETVTQSFIKFLLGNRGRSQSTSGKAVRR